MAAVARVAMSKGIVYKCGVGSYYEGRVDVNNAVGNFFEYERMLGVTLSSKIYNYVSYLIRALTPELYHHTW